MKPLLLSIFFLLLVCNAALPAHNFLSTKITPPKETFIRNTPLPNIKSYQSNENLTSLNLYRYFFDFSLYGVSEYLYTWSSPNKRKYFGTYPGAVLSVGNNFYLTKNKVRLFCKLTWLKVGACFADGILFTCAPLHVGFGNNFKLSSSTSLELSMNGGAIIYGPSTYGASTEFTYAIYPRLMVRINSFCLSFEFTTKPEDQEYLPAKYNYYSVGFGTTF